MLSKTRHGVIKVYSGKLLVPHFSGRWFKIWARSDKFILGKSA